MGFFWWQGRRESPVVSRNLNCKEKRVGEGRVFWVSRVCSLQVFVDSLLLRTIICSGPLKTVKRLSSENYHWHFIFGEKAQDVGRIQSLPPRPRVSRLPFPGGECLIPGASEHTSCGDWVYLRVLIQLAKCMYLIATGAPTYVLLIEIHFP